MPFMQVDEVIQRLRTLHQKLRTCYAVLAEAQPDERTAALLAKMEQHEREVDQGLAAFAERAGKEIRETWVQYVANEQARQAIESTTFHPDLDATEIVRRAVELDEALGYLCSGLATSINATRVSEVFQDILELEQAKAKERSTVLAQLEDA